MIRDIHEGYLAAGADIIETNTFGATRIAQDDYDLGDLAREMNLASAKLAREAADKFSTPDKPRFVAGALGPTPKTASISPDVNDPAARNVDFEQLRAAYYEQVEALVEGGVRPAAGRDHLRHAQRQGGAVRDRRILREVGRARCRSSSAAPSPTPPGRILSGQTVTAFWYSVRHARPLAVGLNCALGAALMRPYIQELARVAPRHLHQLLSQRGPAQSR